MISRIGIGFAIAAMIMATLIVRTLDHSPATACFETQRIDLHDTLGVRCGTLASRKPPLVKSAASDAHRNDVSQLRILPGKVDLQHSLRSPRNPVRVPEELQRAPEAKLTKSAVRHHLETEMQVGTAVSESSVVASMAEASAGPSALTRPDTTASDAGPAQVNPADTPFADNTVADVTASDVDGRTVRSAVAATAIARIAEKTRPSQLLGDAGQSTALATALDGFWGIGQQAATQLIGEGKGPKIRDVKKDSIRIVAAAANQELAGLVEDATQFGEDHGIKFLRNLELRTQWLPGERPSLEARTIDSIFETEALDHTLFLEAGIRTDFEDTTINAGLGYRYVVPDSSWLLGVNAFYDRQFPINHERLSLGIEASTEDLTIFGNRYIPLSDWSSRTAEFDERVLAGWDIGIAGRFPKLEDLRLSLSAFYWEQQTERDKIGLKLVADYDINQAMRLGGTLSGDDSGDWRAGLQLTYDFGADQFGGGGDTASVGGLAQHRLAFVNRENTVKTEAREVPNDYTAAFLASDVNASNEQSLALQLSGAPRSGRYSFTITSSGGGTPVTGAGTVQSDPEAITGIDVSGLADGTLTLTLQVISEDGATGPEVMASISKNTGAVAVATSTASPDPTNVSPIPFTISFSQAVTGFDLGDLSVTNGTPGNLQTADNITWTVDVTPAGQGTVGLQVLAGVATGGGNPNTASNTTSVDYDSLPPAGHAVSFVTNPVNASNQTSVAFAFTNGESGASFSYTISSSGGGANVTGNGTVASNPQQVTNLDLSGLGDGTLTVSLILTDTLGNAGSAVTNTVTKDVVAPVILSITPPLSGTFDDL